MSEITFTALARGAPKGSVRPIKRRDGSVYLQPTAGASLRDFESAVQLAAWSEMIDKEPWLEPISVRARFYFHRPASHYGTGKNRKRLKPSAPIMPCNRAQGDVDKLARALLDAMTGVVFRDDSQVAELELSKRWTRDGPERVEVEAWQNEGVELVSVEGAGGAETSRQMEGPG